MIKHLVLSGGGPSGFLTIGSLQYLNEQNFWNIENIKTIYGTSIGAMISIFISLKFDWETLNNYLINRPWHESLHITLNQILNIYSNKGLFDSKLMEIIFKPLFDAKNISLDITLKDFYEYSRIELHIFSIEINELKLVDISYITHPDLSVINAVMMSCAIPSFITPICKENECYIDGGILLNYPLSKCVDHYDKEEILGFKHEYSNKHASHINADSNILDLMVGIFTKLIGSVANKSPIIDLQYEIINETVPMSFASFNEIISSSTNRQELITCGYNMGEKMYKQWEIIEPCSKTVQ